MKRIILLFLILFELCVSVYAQNTQFPEWKTYLHEYTIHDIADAGDYLWLATGDAVIKFAKTTGNVVQYGFEIPEEYYKPNTHSSMIKWYRDNLVVRIECDKNGLPWACGYFPGIYRMNGDGEWFIQQPVYTDPVFQSVFLILFTDNGTTWTTSHRILSRIEGDKVDTFWINNGISSLAEDMNENIWIGTGGLKNYYDGLLKYDGENWTIFNSSPTGLPPIRFDEIIFDEQGIKWMAGFLGLDFSESKLIKFDDTEWEVFDPPSHSLIYSLAIENNNIFWLGTDNGLMRFNNSNWSVYDTKNSEIPSNQIISVLIESEGTKWLGTDKGLVSLKDSQIKTPVKQRPKMVSEIELFPNPANDFITLKIPVELQNSTVDILNTQGQTVKTFSVNKNNSRLDVRFLPDGVYLVRFQSDENFVTKRFVKQQ